MRILMIEDDDKLCQVVSLALAQNGYTVDVCQEGDDGLRWMKEPVYDLVLLDRMLPRMDGITVLHRARKEGVSTPVLMVTALDALGQRVEGLDAGADDYITKPFEIEELLARIRALGRRPRQWENRKVYRVGDISFDPLQKELCCGENRCILSKREADLMETLLMHAGQTMPRPTLLSRVWGPDAGVEDSNLDNYVHFLRRRLRKVGSRLQLKTIRGVGYQVSADD